jgi:hypothetical protein
MAWYPASYPGTAAWRSGHVIPVSCCLSAAGLRFLGILFPPRNSALLTVGLPALAHRTLTGFPCSARVRCGWGRASSIPRERRCPHGRVCSTTAACRITAARPLSPRCCIPAREVMLTRHHQGFPVSRPAPSLPLACHPQPERGPLGFSMSSVPGRYRPRTSWRGQVTDTNRSHITGISQPPYPTDSLLTCDLTSQALRIPHGSRKIRHLCPFALWSGSPGLQNWQGVTPGRVGRPARSRVHAG